MSPDLLRAMGKVPMDPVWAEPGRAVAHSIPCGSQSSRAGPLCRGPGASWGEGDSAVLP